MNTRIIAVTASLLWLGGTVWAGEGDVEWGYRGKRGPDHWGYLHPSFAVCLSGSNQSPVNLSGFVEAELPSIEFEYTTEATEIVNKDHTLHVSFAPGSRIRVGGQVFELKEIQFRTPSEHRLEGKSFAMEGQLMHADAQGTLAVVALLYEEGPANATLARLWTELPEYEGDNLPLAPGVKAEDLLPDDRDYYRLNGSLTTPPCSEGVWWLMMKQPLSVSRDQVATYAELMHHNNRPVQPLNARPVLK